MKTRVYVGTRWARHLVLWGAPLVAGGCFDGGPLEPTDPSTVIAIVVTPARAWIAEGGEVTLTVRGLTAVGGELAGTGARFRSQDPSLATVSESGTVLGVRPGEAQIVVEAFGHTVVSHLSILPIVPPASGWGLDLESINRSSLLGLWAGTNRTVAVGSDGSILERESGAWQVRQSPSTELLTGVWGANDDDIWAVGTGGTILHFDGTHWDPVPSPVPTTFLGIWGMAADAIWAVGVNVVLRYDGQTWAAMELPSGPHELWSIWGSSEDDLHAVGQDGRILQFDGQRWAVVPSPTAGVLFGVHGVSANEVYAVGLSGTILLFDGTTWRSEMSPTTSNLFGIDGRGSGTVTAVGNRGVVIRRTGQNWTLVPQPVSSDNLRAVSVEGPDRFRVAGWSGTILARATGSWIAEAAGDDLFALTLTREGSVWVAGLAGTVLRQEGPAWPRIMVPTPNAIFGLAGNSDQDLIAVGDSSTILHYDGAVWSPVVLSSGAPSLPILWRSVWMAPTGDAVVVGQGGRILHRSAGEGGAWTSASSPTDVFLRHVFGLDQSKVYAVGDGGAILIFDGSSWRVMPSPVRSTIRGIWGSGVDDLFAVGDGGVILRFDGQRWYTMASPVTSDLRAVWGTGPIDVYAVGEDGVVLRYDGSRWSEQFRIPVTFLLGISGRNGKIVAVGQGMHVLTGFHP